MTSYAYARLFGYTALAVVGLAIWFGLAPEPPVEIDDANRDVALYERLIDAAISDHEANEELAESAPQQQVVNGWVARDLLHIGARAAVDQLAVDVATLESSQRRDDRIPALLVLLILGVSYHGASGMLTPRGPARSTA